MAIRLSQEHWSTVDDVKYKVEVHDNAWAGAVSSFDDNFFEITWDNEDDDFLTPIKASTCRYVLYDDDSATFAAFRNTLASAEENRFALVIYKWNGATYDLHWVGVIMTDMVQWNNENSPREFEILAKDGLNRLDKIKFTEILSSPFTTSEQTFIYIINAILSKNSLAAFYTGDYIKVSIDWNEIGQTLPATQRILEYVSIWGDLLREPTKVDSETKNDLEPYTCQAILQGLLRLFAARIVCSEGCYHIQQVSNFTTDTYSEAVYDNTGTYDSVNTGVSIKSSVNGGTFRVLDNGKFGYHAAYRSARLTAKGYLDVRGAYVDEAIVDEANRVYTQTMKLGTILGGGSTFATATILAADNLSGADIELRANKIGASGNSISFTTATSSDQIYNQVMAYNAANPNYQFIILSGNVGTLITTARTYNFTGGVTGTGQANRALEIDFELTNYSQLSDAEASNMQFRIDIKLICGSHRIKNSNANNIEVEWSTTAADKWSYLIKGNVYTANKFSLITPEIPFESENNCTLELTVTLQRVSTAVAFPSANDFGGIFHDFRVIAWDSTRKEISDQVVVVENPDNTTNSIEMDFGNIFIGDDPVVQSSISSKNYLIVNDGSGVFYRSNVWDAGFDTDYNLTNSLLMNAVALRRQPTEKYMGAFRGDYAAWKSIGYDSGRWVMNTVKYNSRDNEWEGSWWKINYSRADITVSSERLIPPPIGLRPFRKPFVIKNDFPTNSKGTGVYPYTAGMGTINAIDVDALDNKLFRSGDSMQVYHPTRGELLDTFVVDSDTTVSDTTIDIVGATTTSDIPVGALLEHNSKEVVASTKVRAEQFVQLGANFRKAEFLVAGDYTVGGGFYYYFLDNTANLVLVDLSADLVNTYRSYLPEIADCFQNGQSIVITIKGQNGSHAVFPHPDDTTAGANIITTSAVASLNVSGGNQRSFITDGTDWHTIGF